MTSAINDNENEAENENKRSQRYDINRPKPRYEHKYTTHKICLSIIMVICIKQQLGNICCLIHEKVEKKAEAELKKRAAYIKKRVFHLRKKTFIPNRKEKL